MIPFHPKAHVTLEGQAIVQVERSFRAPATLVYRALTEPALLKRWQLGPPGWTLPVCEMDVRVGGKYRNRWRSNEDGKEFGFFGEFLEVVPSRRLVHTEFFDPGDIGGDMGDGATIATDFLEAEGVTTLRIRMDFHTQAARDAALSTGMTDGMEMSYALLETLIAEGGLTP